MAPARRARLGVAGAWVEPYSARDQGMWLEPSPLALALGLSCKSHIIASPHPWLERFKERYGARTERSLASIADYLIKYLARV